MRDSACSIPNCDWGGGYLSAGLCPAHYRRKRLGQPMGEIPRFGSVQERFWSKVDVGDPEECWEWRGCLTTTGYGQFASRKTPELGRKAHRHAFFYTYGGLDPEKVLDHKCRNRTCVNPGHLREVTVAENSENLKIRSDNRSGYRGVSFISGRTQPWRGCVSQGGTIIWMQFFDTREEAAEATRLKRLEVYTLNELDK